MGGVYRDSLEAEIKLASGRAEEALPRFVRAVLSDNLILDWDIPEVHEARRCLETTA